MNKLILSMAFFFFITTLVAQSWAPVGTKWTYSFSSQSGLENSPATIECIGDTVIEGKFCRIFNQGFVGWGNKSYLYYENDKVYMYLNSIMGFHVLYDFTVKAGDSWQIIFPVDGINNDTSILIVDSIGTTIISGETFSIQYVRNLTPYSDFWQFGGKIIKYIGNVNYFFPNFTNSHAYFGPIRCYQDSFRTLKFSKIPCDTTIVWGKWTPDNYKDTINIYPNPFRSDLFIEFNYKDQFEYEIEIYSIVGDKVISLTGINKRITGINEKKIKIPLERFSNGIYILKITTTTGQSIIRKIIKE